jgi:hypothetical protein
VIQLVRAVLNGGSGADVAASLEMMLFVPLLGYLLYRVTRNYLRKSGPPDPSCDARDHQEPPPCS